jgi:hypothetical protein
MFHAVPPKFNSASTPFSLAAGNGANRDPLLA